MAYRRPLGGWVPIEVLSEVNVLWSLDFVSHSLNDGRR